MAFSSQEKSTIVALVNCQRSLADALGTELAVALSAGQDPIGMLTVASQNIVSASRETVQVLTLLMGQNNSASFNDPTPERATALTSAWFHLDRISMFIDMAIANLNGAIGVNTLRAKSIWLPQAKSLAVSVNRGLAYTDPSPHPANMDGFVTIIGPHGDYNHSEWSIARAWWYMLDAMDEGVPKLGAVGFDGPAFVAKSMGIANICATGIARFGGITTLQSEQDIIDQIHAQNPNVDPQFWLILAYGQVLTDFNIPSGVSGPGFYQQIQDAVAKTDGAFATCRSKITDSWRRMDNATWHALLAFPGCDLQTNPAGCAAKLPSQQPPTTPPPAVVAPRLTGLTFSDTISGTLTTTVTSDQPGAFAMLIGGKVATQTSPGVFSFDTRVLKNGTYPYGVTVANANGMTSITGSLSINNNKPK